MNKLSQFVKKITPRKLIGIQFIYASFVIAVGYTLANQVQAVLYEGKVISRNEHRNLLKRDYGNEESFLGLTNKGFSLWLEAEYVLSTPI